MLFFFNPYELLEPAGHILESSLFVVGPETDDFDGPLLIEDLIDQTVLGAYSPRTSTRQIAC
jgi:hypothetical protein